jgi:hypothetical protein
VSAIAAPRLRTASAPRLALGLGALALLLLAACVPLSVLAHQANAGTLFNALSMTPFAGVGMLVAAKRPRNTIGWLLLALALVGIAGGDAGFYSVYAYRIEHHGLLLSRLAVVLATGWAPLIVLLPLPLFLFPDGRVPEGRWRATFWIYLAAGSTFLISIAVQDVAAFTARRFTVDSSGELTSLGQAPHGTSGAITLVLLGVWTLIGLSWVLRLVLGYRHSEGDRRQQLKWLLGGGAICIAGFLGSAAVGNSTSMLAEIVSALDFCAIAALPLSLGLGILKYRLYEIDRLISRTLSYALLTGLLVGVFAGSVLLTTRVLPFSSPIGVAASTLVAAGLFSPLRVRLQRLVDRRFNRARYDAEATVAAFAASLRDAVDVDAVLGELATVAGRSLEPAHVTVWVRSAP